MTTSANPTTSRRFFSVAAVLAAAMLFPGLPAGAAEGDDEALLAKGKYLLHAGGCISCHKGDEDDAHPLAGGHALTSPFGVFYSPNITPDVETGIGSWTDEDFLNAFWEGENPEGDHYFPAFPFTAYTGMSRDDLLALKAYLFSVEPVKKQNREHDLWAIMSSRFSAGVWKARYFDAERFEPDAGQSDEWNRGAYLVRHLGHCGECHTPRSTLGALEEDEEMAGNPELTEDESAPNITPASAKRHRSLVCQRYRLLPGNRHVAGRRFYRQFDGAGHRGQHQPADARRPPRNCRLPEIVAAALDANGAATAQSPPGVHMNRIVTVVALATTVLAACGKESPPAAEGPDHRAAAIESVTGAEVRQHMEVLASDDMQGREAGTEFYERAADYVVSHYRAAGLKPLGDDGSYLQSIEFFESRLIPESAQFSLQKDDANIELVFRDDFIRSGGFGAADEEVSAELAFVGHGIVAPELDHDDYADIDVSGKILVVLSGAPPGFDTDRRAFYSSSRGKATEAVAQGAIGMINVRTPVDQARRPWARYLPGVGSPGMRWLDAEGKPYQGFPELQGSATSVNPVRKTV